MFFKFTTTKHSLQMNIGHRIKNLRTQNNLTLEELASRCELTKGFLSQVERDLTSPSIATLNDVVTALGLSLAQFFQDDIDGKIIFSPADFFEDKQEGSNLAWIVSNAKKNKMEPILLDLLPHQTSFEISPHEGEEFAYILQGKCSLVYNGKSHLLKKGYTFYIHGAHSHHIRNDSDQICKVLWISTPPRF